jgi:hypothetical protein
VPRELQYLYEWFCDLSASRGSNGYAPNPLSPSGIRDWSEMSGHRLNPWEFDLLRAMDRKWMKVYSDLNKPDQTNNTKSKTNAPQQ